MNLQTTRTIDRRLSLVAPLLALAVGVAPLTSCSDLEIATGAAVVAAGAVIAAGAAHHPRPENCERHEERVCREYRNYYGEWVEDCDTVTRRYRCDDDHHHHGHDFARSLIEASLASGRLTSDAQVPVRSIIDAVEVSQSYNLSLASAERFLSALERAQAGDLEAILELGLSKSDVDLMARLRMPSQDGIDRVARELNQDPIMTGGMIGKIVYHGQQLKKEECASKKAQGVSDRFTDHYCI